MIILKFKYIISGDLENHLSILGRKKRIESDRKVKRRMKKKKGRGLEIRSRLGIIIKVGEKEMGSGGVRVGGRVRKSGGCW